MSPISIIITLIVVFGRDLELSTGEFCGMRTYGESSKELTKVDTNENSVGRVTKKTDSAETRNCFLRYSDRYSRWANGVGNISQDIPLNRFSSP